jgi:predicted small metal-binding protein
MTTATVRLTCACGWQTTGDRDEVYEAALDHGRRLHNMEVTREQVDEMSAPVGEDERLSEC